MAVRLEAEELRKTKEDKRADTFLVAAYRTLLNISLLSDLTVQVIPIWPAHKWAPKYRQLLEIQDQIDRMDDALSVKLPTVTTSGLLTKVVTLNMILCDPEDLPRVIKPFVLGQYTVAQREIFRRSPSSIPC